MNESNDIKDALSCIMIQRSTDIEINNGKLGTMLLFIRGIGQVALYLRQKSGEKKAFTGFQTWFSEDQQRTHFFYRYKPTDQVKDYVIERWHELKDKSKSINKDYMKVWSMSEEDYIWGEKKNDKLGILNTIIRFKPDSFNCLIGYADLATIYGEIHNIPIGYIKENNDASFFVMDPSFYDQERQINYSKFKLYPEVKIFLCRLIQYAYDNGDFLLEPKEPDFKTIAVECFL